jgi:hypothetical protein
MLANQLLFVQKLPCTRGGGPTSLRQHTRTLCLLIIPRKELRESSSMAGYKVPESTQKSPSCKRSMLDRFRVSPFSTVWPDIWKQSTHWLGGCLGDRSATLPTLWNCSTCHRCFGSRGFWNQAIDPYQAVPTR